MFHVSCILYAYCNVSIEKQKQLYIFLAGVKEGPLFKLSESWAFRMKPENQIIGTYQYVFSSIDQKRLRVSLTGDMGWVFIVEVLQKILVLCI